MKALINLFLFVFFGISSLFLLFLSSQNSFAQCLDSGNVWNESWVSCNTSPSPNTERGTMHWVQYDLGELYKIGDITLWNLNRAGESQMGAKEIVLDYSIDGIQWASLEEITLNQASELDTYEGEVAFSVGGDVARYVLVGVLSNYDNGNCTGIAEVKISLEPYNGELLPVEVKTYLEAYLQPFPMSNQLEINGLLPQMQPFNIAPWNYAGTEMLSSTVTDIADWILLEIQNADGTILIRQAAILKVDGTVVNTRGNIVSFDLTDYANKYLALYHKAHLAVVSAEEIVPNIKIDFTQPFKTQGVEQTKNYMGFEVMIAGDFDNNGIINNWDYNAWEVDKAGVNVYFHHDADGNGVINNNDYNFWVANRSKIGFSTIQY